jgi:hypothetical protein
MFTAIDFGIASPSLLHIAASLLQDISSVEPVLEMAATELAFFVLLVAGALSWLLDFDFVIGKLRGSRCARSYGCGQKVHPRSGGQCRRIPSVRILLEAFCRVPGTWSAPHPRQFCTQRFYRTCSVIFRIRSILDAHQIQPSCGCSRARRRAVACLQDLGDLFWFQSAFADQHKRSHQVSDHVVQEAAPANGVHQLVRCSIPA